MYNTTNFSFEDGLLCDEQEQDLDFDSFEPKVEIFEKKNQFYTHFENDLLWEEDEVSCLLGKEVKNVMSEEKGGLIGISVLMGLRKEAVDWIIRVCGYYGFVGVTSVLAVNYFDRFLLSPAFQKDKPWMNQLAAVACLSLASKVEEIQAPLLMDLQVEGAKFVFESKTIMKMELLVLSALEWKMNPVTPISFIDYIMRRLGLVTHCRHSELVRRCERVVIAVINDSRSLDYLPSVIATATMNLVIKEVDPDNAYNYQNQLKGFLDINEELLDECSKLILEVTDYHGTSYLATRKRKYPSAPGSPNGVIDSYFSSDNSCDSWAAASSVSSSPEPVLKKIRAQEQQMRLAPVSRVSISTFNNFH
uniref:Cyclin, C-terminal domain-containing protein n=1 Tax=Tanacetum cinerariifolium TaxID=118510 RepID=A0A6L2KTW0_TANCI|nr:cyclin, C-terminal domain-containing protein [Tanacetum cinerariifolium]